MQMSVTVFNYTVEERTERTSEKRFRKIHEGQFDHDTVVKNEMQN